MGNDFYKGSPILYLKYFSGHENFEFEPGVYGTTEVIYFIFEKLSFQKMNKEKNFFYKIVFFFLYLL